MSACKLAGQTSLRTFFQQLDTSFIRQNPGLDIYHKGMDYYRQRAVDELETILPRRHPVINGANSKLLLSLWHSQKCC